MYEDRFLEDLSAYAIGALAVADQQRIEKHLEEGCDLCESELVMFRETANRLVYDLPNVPMRSSLKEEIRAGLENKVAARKFRPVRLTAAAAMIALALVAYFYSRIDREPQWLRDPSVQLAVLDGISPAEQAGGKVIWNPVQARGLFYGKSLPAIGNEQSYQIWIIDRTGPMSAGVFEADASGSAVVFISRTGRSIQEPLQFAVTVEPKGGVPQPTGSMILAGKIL